MMSLRHRRRAGFRALLLLVPLLAACVAPMGRADLLAFIEDGRTTREDAYMHLGEPAASYEEERILCFRIGRDDGGDFVLGRASGFQGVRTSLIMAFDEQGLLKRHSLVQVKAP